MFKTPFHCPIGIPTWLKDDSKQTRSDKSYSPAYCKISSWEKLGLWQWEIKREVFHCEEVYNIVVGIKKLVRWLERCRRR